MQQMNVPNHVGIIMDGNGRWGEKQGKHRTDGHHAGARNVKEIIKHAHTMQLPHLSLWGFSTDNWNRPRYEVDVLLSLFNRYIVSEADELHAADVRVTFIGNREGLPKQLQRVMHGLQERTSENAGMHVQLAINYGGRDELVRAVQALATDIQEGVLDPYALTAAHITAALDTALVPDPDLIIRTGGEYRLSGFMPYQTVASELFFSELLWPDFTPAEFDRALMAYQTRDRRFGGLSRNRQLP